MLRIIASSIAAVVRPYDSVGCCGGEEFLIVAPGCGMAETWELAERVRSHVAGCNIMVDGSSVQVSLSLGIATGKTAADIEQLLHAADTALYQAKNAGRNRVEPSIGRAASAAQSPSPAPRDFLAVVQLLAEPLFPNRVLSRRPNICSVIETPRWPSQ